MPKKNTMPFKCTLPSLFLTILILISNSIAAQDETTHPVFSTFQGVVYKLPIKRLKKGYGNDILKMLPVDTIYWEEINFPDSDIAVPFPDVNFTQGFGIIFTGTVQIPKDAYYQFATNSDDGSILWIDGTRVVNNDHDHRMRLRVDSIALQAGTYPIKLWYYQAYPTRYGIQLDARFYRDFYPAEAINTVSKTHLVFDQQQLQFEHNSSKLLPKGLEVIDSLARNLADKTLQHIKITGYTDDTGSASYNLQLSLARATAVKTALLEYFDPKIVTISVFGKGESEPLASNETTAGKAQNRRVEIDVKFK